MPIFILKKAQTERRIIMRGRKNLVVLVMALLFSFSFIFTAFATEQAGTPTEVKKIYLQVSQDKNGDIQSVYAKSLYSEQYDVTYDYGYDNYIGERPSIVVTVTAKNGYVFYKDFDRSSHFSISGGKFEDGYRKSNTVVVVEISCSKIVKEQLETPTGLEWEDDNGRASWEAVDYADYYVVSINGNKVNAYDNYISLGTYLKYRKDNKFRVKAVSNRSYIKESEWSEYSDELYFEDWNDYYDDYYSDGSWNIDRYPGGNYGGNNGNNYSGLRNQWVQRGNVWYYYDGNGYRLRNGEYRIGNKWYVFDNEGVMKTGWWNKRYYDSDGARASGWRYINNAWFYLAGDGSQVTNRYVNGMDGKVYYVISSMLVNGWHENHYFGNDGAMVKNAWAYTNGGWYYLDANGYALRNTIGVINNAVYKFGGEGKLCYGWFDYNGASYYIKPDGNMARNEWINGYYVDSYGRWIR